MARVYDPVEDYIRRISGHYPDYPGDKERREVRRLRGWLRALQKPIEDYNESTASCGDEQEEIRLLRLLAGQLKAALSSKRKWPPKKQLEW